jgi:hypothetical protein
MFVLHRRGASSCLQSLIKVYDDRLSPFSAIHAHLDIISEYFEIFWPIMLGKAIPPDAQSARPNGRVKPSTFLRPGSATLVVSNRRPHQDAELQNQKRCAPPRSAERMNFARPRSFHLRSKMAGTSTDSQELEPLTGGVVHQPRGGHICKPTPIWTIGD